VYVENVDDSLEVAQYVVVSAHVSSHDAANDVLTQAAQLLDGQVVERVRPGVLQDVKAV